MRKEQISQTTDSPKDNVSNPQPASVAYSPQNVVSLATAKCQAGGMITTQQNLQNHLNDGSITQEEYNEYYPYDGMEGSYYSVFVETDLNKNIQSFLLSARLIFVYMVIFCKNWSFSAKSIEKILFLI